MNRKNINWLERLSVVILANEPSCVVKEVNCGIKDAVASGQISEVRYQSYCKIYNELKQKEENKW